MRPFMLLPALGLLLASCTAPADTEEPDKAAKDSATLIGMLRAREKAMIDRDLDAIVQPFDSSASFINGGGYYYSGIEEIREFHRDMFENDSLTYTFKTGTPFVRMLKRRTALVYYPWAQDWTMKTGASDTLHETGVMTIIAQKERGEWKWMSMTNQRTKEYFNDLRAHTAPK
ncbi:MAG: nuclear transport factor 2 family protein [Chitinophagaceae bacterium]|nr:MAG: nuclear transport factor 2 family protein [Chitinophagaceae bacterium]